MDTIIKCKKCKKRTVIDEVMFNSESGMCQICLNCGWYETQEYLTDEEVLQNYQETYPDEYEEMKKNKQIEELL